MIAALISWKALAIIGAVFAAIWILQDLLRGPCHYCGGTGEIGPAGATCEACEGYGR